MSENVSKLVPYVMPMSDMLSRIYPVGSIYMSVTSASPADLFGGTWERIKDRFLLASGDTYSAGSTGGEANHTLTVNEMPSHAHNFDNCISGYPPYSLGRDGKDKYRMPLINILNPDDTAGAGQYTNAAGNSKPHNNMPPYLTVYMWKRIAYEDSVVLSLQNGRLVMYRSKVSQDGINFILSNHKNLIVMHTDKVDFDIIDHQRLEASYK